MSHAHPGPEAPGFDAKEIEAARLRWIIQDLLVRITEMNVGIEMGRFRSLADLHAFITQVVQAPVIAAHQQGGNDHGLPHYKQAEWLGLLACLGTPHHGDCVYQPCTCYTCWIERLFGVDSRPEWGRKGKEQKPQMATQDEASPPVETGRGGPPALVQGLAERNQTLEKLFWLAARDVVFFSTYNDATKDWDDDWHPAVNLNDTFCYACADADPVRDDELDLLIDVYRRFGDDGVTAWAAIKRNVAPIGPRQTEAYHAARRYLTEQAAGREEENHA